MLSCVTYVMELVTLTHLFSDALFYLFLPDLVFWFLTSLYCNILQFQNSKRQFDF